jgi:hypothetical protein
MPSRRIDIATPTSKLYTSIAHFPRDHRFAHWDRQHGRVQPKNQRTFAAYKRQLWAPPSVPKKKSSPWLNMIPKWLRSISSWAIQQVRPQPHAEDLMVSGALAEEEDAGAIEIVWEEDFSAWDSMEAREVELGLC